jgi:hypothetical protein
MTLCVYHLCIYLKERGRKSMYLYVSLCLYEHVVLWYMCTMVEVEVKHFGSRFSLCPCLMTWTLMYFLFLHYIFHATLVHRLPRYFLYKLTKRMLGLQMCNMKSGAWYLPNAVSCFLLRRSSGTKDTGENHIQIPIPSGRPRHLSWYETYLQTPELNLPSSPLPHPDQISCLIPAQTIEPSSLPEGPQYPKAQKVHSNQGHKRSAQTREIGSPSRPETTLLASKETTSNSGHRTLPASQEADSSQRQPGQLITG